MVSYLMPRKRLAGFIFLFGIAVVTILFVTGAIQEEEMIYEGFVVDSLTGHKLPFVHILNESSRVTYITDSMGKFRIACRGGDTLAIISLGYLGRVVIVDSLQKAIALVPRSYKIEEVRVQTYRSYDQFKKDFMDAAPHKEKKIEGLPEAKPIDIPILLDTNIISSPAFMVFHPLSYLYYNFSKEEKSKRKAYYLKRQEGERLIIEKKYNRDIVQRITGLEGDDLTNFIGFCNFDHTFLFESTELEIVRKIYEKLAVYKAIRDPYEKD